MKHPLGRSFPRGRIAVAVCLLCWLCLQTGWTADFSAWNRRMYIACQGYGAGEILTNFPLLLHLQEGVAGFSYGQVKSPQGTDLRFADDTRTNELTYEIDTWNPAGISYVWVRIPLVTNGLAFWAYWGNANAPLPSYATNGAVWSNGYAGVWHLGATNGVHPDSTSNGNHGAWLAGDVTATSMTCQTDLTGGQPWYPVDGDESASSQLEGTGNPRYWQIDLGSGNSRVVTRFLIKNWGGGWSTKDFTFQGSVDAADWQTLYSGQIPYSAVNPGPWQPFNFFTNRVAYRHYKANLLSNWGTGHDILEVELIGSDPHAFVPGQVDGAELLDGTNDWVECADSASLRAPATQFTLEGWCFFTATNGTRPVAAKQSDTGNWNSYSLQAGEGSFWCYTDNRGASTYASVKTGPVARTGEWQYVVGIWNRQAGTVLGDFSIYVNGVRQSITVGHDQGYSMSYTPGYSSLPFTIGRFESPGFVQGQLDEVRVSSLARSSNWLWACWMNTASNAVFLRYGPTYGNKEGILLSVQ